MSLLTIPKELENLGNMCDIGSSYTLTKLESGTFEYTKTSHSDLGLDVLRVIGWIFLTLVFLVATVILHVMRGNLQTEVLTTNIQIELRQQAAEIQPTISPDFATLQKTALVLLNQMKQVVEWARDPENVAFLNDHDVKNQLAESHAVSWIASGPNGSKIFIGGGSCFVGVTYWGPYHKEDKLIPPTTKDDTSNLERKYEDFGIDRRALKKVTDRKEIAPHFVNYSMYPGNGPFDLVLSANGGTQPDFGFNLKGEPCSTRDIYLKDKGAQMLDVELYRGFGKGGKDEANYDQIIQHIDKAVDEFVSGNMNIISHCSSGVERSVSIATGVFVRLFQRAGIEYTEELLNFITEFLQVRRPSASKFDDPLDPDILEQIKNGTLRDDITPNVSIYQMRINLMKYLHDNSPSSSQEIVDFREFLDQSTGGGGGSKRD